MQRKYAKITLATNKKGGYSEPQSLTFVSKEGANVVTSLAQPVPPLHMPCLDLDIPCRLMESKTPGHYHLYIDVLMPWREYKRVLKAMMKAGLIEKGWYERALTDEFTTLVFADERTPTEAIIEELDATIRDNSG
jgi:hypothetical protein